MSHKPYDYASNRLRSEVPNAIVLVDKTQRLTVAPELLRLSFVRPGISALAIKAADLTQYLAKELVTAACRPVSEVAPAAKIQD